MAELKESKAAKRKRLREEGKGRGGSHRLAADEGNYSEDALSPDDGVVIKSDQGESGGDGEATPTVPPANPPAEKSPGSAPAPSPPPARRTRTKRKPPIAPATTGPFAKRSAPLSVLSFNTTQELWQRYEQLAFDVTEKGRKVSVSEVIRIVLADQLPDLTSDEGKADALELASAWTRERGRGQTEAKFSAIRLRLPMITELKQVALDARKAGASLDPSRLISGVLSTSELTASEILERDDE